MLVSSALLLGCVLTQTWAYTQDALADQVKNLPGTEKLNIKFNQFSGYLSIPGTSGANTKHMHYWFVESTSNPSSDPLTFWTNGGKSFSAVLPMFPIHVTNNSYSLLVCCVKWLGPGCSGLIGFMTEQGPFKPTADLSLVENEYAWNKVSNMVFIESPAGVGFSYSDDKVDYTTGDSQTAIDNYNLIQAFLARFPEYRANSLYISSESYGGHYMPTLAKQIVDMNAQADATNKLNFKGFAVGNPYTDPFSGTPAMIETYWGHQLVPQPTYLAFKKACSKSTDSIECITLAGEIMNGVGDLNPYALDYPVCTDGSPRENHHLAKKGRAQRLWQLNHMMHVFSKGKVQMNALTGIKLTGDYEPCADNYAVSYLNQASVKTALHVKKDIKWDECSYKLKYNMTDNTEVSTAPIYNYLIDGGYGLNLLVYSGDDDGVCGTIGTQNWIWALGYDVAPKPWSTYTYNQQTAGYLTKWKNTKLAFLTIHGAGHEVPTYKPDVALDMFTRYLAGEFTNN